MTPVYTLWKIHKIAFSAAHYEQVYLHCNPLVFLFSEVYQVQAIVNWVFQTAIEWRIAEALLCSQYHLYRRQSTQTSRYNKMSAAARWVSFCHLSFHELSSYPQIHTWSWSQCANVGEMCTHSVLLSTVSLRWLLWCSTATWCQCWSSSRLPRVTRYRLSGDKLFPGAWEEDEEWHDHVVTVVKRENSWLLKPFSLPMAISITSLTFLSAGCQDLFHVETVYFNSVFLQMISAVKEFDSDIFISNCTAGAIASPPPPLWKWSFKFLINLNSPLFSRSLKWCHGVTVFCRGLYLGNKTKARSTLQKEPENTDGETFSN